MAVLPDLRRDASGPNFRAGRAHSALRRNNRGGGVNDTPLAGISRVDLCFPYSNREDNHQKSGGKICDYLHLFVFVLHVYFDVCRSSRSAE